MGCNGRIFKENAAQNSYVFWLHWASMGVKWRKSEGVKDKLNPTLTLTFFCSVKGVKRCKSSGVISPLPRLFSSFYPLWKLNAAQKIVRVLSCIFLKNPRSGAPLLRNFGGKNSTRDASKVTFMSQLRLGLYTNLSETKNL